MTTAANREKDSAILALFHAGLWTLPNWWPFPEGQCACGDPDCDSPGKHPIPTWKPYQLRAPTETEVQNWLRKFPDANWGVVLGAAAGVIVVDFDGAGAEGLLLESGVELPACASWRSPGGAKVLLKHPGGILQKHIRFLKANGCGVDLLADGSQVVVPPSQHYRGGRYEWVIPLGEGIADPPTALLDLVRTASSENGTGSRHTTSEETERIPKGERNTRLASLAGTMRRRGLSPEAIVAALLIVNCQRCDPPLSEQEVREIAESIGQYPPGPETNQRPRAETTSDSRILDPADPLPSARDFVAQSHMIGAILGLRHHGGVFYEYDGAASAYRERDEAAIRADLYTFLEPALRWIEPRGEGGTPKLGPFKPTQAKVENVLDALRAVCNLATSFAPPCWLQDDPGLDPFEILACRNGLLHIPTRTLLPATPAFFTLNGLDFAYDPDAPAPAHWLRFLMDLWPEDMDKETGKDRGAECRETLQEMMGYCLTPRTHFQKMFLLVGPKRSGKGTIARVLRRLLGERNVCGPTLANMGEQFGLSTLIGKSVATISDARIGGRTDTTVITERLLSISGEDALSIPRKYLPDWNGKLSTRFLLLTNELPRIEDHSGALASRFILLTLHRSFYGREDHGLFDRFLPELPGILNWALVGWDRLYQRGRFVQPVSSAEVIEQFEELGSPIAAFVRERCEIGGGFEVAVSALFSAWKSWCDDTGREKPGTVQTLGRNLVAAHPWLKGTRHLVLTKQVRYWEGIRLKD